MIKKRLFVILVCVLLTIIGWGILERDGTDNLQFKVVLVLLRLL